MRAAEFNYDVERVLRRQGITVTRWGGKRAGDNKVTWHMDHKNLKFISSCEETTAQIKNRLCVPRLHITQFRDHSPI